MSKYSKKNCDLFVEQLVKSSQKKKVIFLIEREIENRLKKYGFYKDTESRVKDCISETNEFNFLQMQLPLDKRGKKKIDRWLDNPEYYHAKYWRNAAITYCRRKIREWLKKGSLFISREDSETASVNNSHEVYTAFNVERRRYENMLNPTKHTQNQIQCFIDKLNGMTYSGMMKKYEPENIHKDKKGQKYRRRFDRFVDQLGIKEEIKTFLEKTKRIV